MRLIDADALIQSMLVFYGDYRLFRELETIIDNEPTIAIEEREMTREKAIEILTTLQDGNGRTYEAIRMAIEALEADTVEVVRCKDCKHCEVLNTKDFYAICNQLDILFEPFEDDTRTHFCAWGERSEE